MEKKNLNEHLKKEGFERDINILNNFYFAI